MSNDTTFDYLDEFYGSSAQWFGIYLLVISLFTIISDLFFITFTMTTKSLRTNVSNWFLLGFIISDLVHCNVHLVDAYALLYGSTDNRHLCAVAGLFVISTAMCSFGFPAIIAAARFYKITTVSQSTS
uniref:G-protein coupled receptors family 1 profile domain-containing protein n=1 Tax=Plectus sambesii TaxID=2011161 RepID=A0A914VDJ2_9BILA